MQREKKLSANFNAEISRNFLWEVSTLEESFEPDEADAARNKAASMTLDGASAKLRELEEFVASASKNDVDLRVEAKRRESSQLHSTGQVGQS